MKILITYITGVGNTILFLPTLRLLRQQLPEAGIDIMVRHQASKDILERVGCSRKIYVFNVNTHKTLIAKMRFLRSLRQERYDLNITAFPSNRAEFNLLSFLIGAKRRIAPKYQAGYLRTLSFLQTDFVETGAHDHDVEQNLALLVPIGIDISGAQKRINWETTAEEITYAEACLKKARLTSHDVLIGFHPGCNPNQGNILKRWPTKDFALLGDQLAEAFGAKILVFGASDETPLKEAIYTLMKHKPVIPENASLLKIAALIKRCILFVTNDSGLMHVAAAMQVPTVSLFGPSDPARNAPYGNAHIVLQAELSCMPCNKYPYHQYGGSYIRCIYTGDRKGYCMQSLSVEQVYAAIVQKYAHSLRVRDA